jgi:starch phosphorylase
MCENTTLEPDAVANMTLYEQLNDLAFNLRWDWDAPTRDLFRDLDPGLWESVEHNPVALLRRLDRDRVDADRFAPRVDAAWRDLRAYLEPHGVWFGEEAPAGEPLVAYFSAEYGLTESLRIYSGGLGVLAGDHLKSASDLGIPLVAVGLLYREGYFVQAIGPGGGQRESFPAADFEDLPLRAAVRPDGSPLQVAIPFPGRHVSARVWRLQVGRVPLYLLDTDVPGNDDDDRRLTARLYGGESEMRIAQEIVLGMGGYRALDALGIRPRAYHMNEGHSAFLGLDLVRDLMQARQLGLQAAMEAARERCVFTTHTPVPAGHDRFDRPLMERYFTATARSLDLDMDRLMDLGREHPGDADEPFIMTVLATRLAGQINGVSELHGAVSREMWQDLWPDRRLADVPIGHITNGVHLPSWVHPAIAEAYGVPPRDLGLDDREPTPDPQRLWRLREERRAELVTYVRERVGAELDPGALTIAFARRFATYKRATLLFRDLDRLERLLCNPDRPVQLLFAGKAHPRDQGGKGLIRQIVRISREERFRNRVVFLPGYGIDVGRALVRGADVWLNNPRRPNEASGTSGMKAAANGVLNVSVLDGWWDEAWRSARERSAPIGWAIGNGRVRPTQDATDRADFDALLSVLEGEVVPAFYERDGTGTPREWARRMAESIRQVAPFFNTHRMLVEYVERYRRAADVAAAGTRG